MQKSSYRPFPLSVTFLEIVLMQLFSAHLSDTSQYLMERNGTKRKPDFVFLHTFSLYNHRVVWLRKFKYNLCRIGRLKQQALNTSGRPASPQEATSGLSPAEPRAPEAPRSADPRPPPPAASPAPAPHRAAAARRPLFIPRYFNRARPLATARVTPPALPGQSPCCSPPSPPQGGGRGVALMAAATRMRSAWAGGSRVGSRGSAPWSRLGSDSRGVGCAVPASLRRAGRLRRAPQPGMGQEGVAP